LWLPSPKRLFPGHWVWLAQPKVRSGCAQRGNPCPPAGLTVDPAYPLFEQIIWRTIMKRLIAVLMATMALLVLARRIHAQDLLVPAGTLLQCTMDEPNFSSATAAIGDPVLCHLRTMQEFGKPLFPRGSMLVDIWKQTKSQVISSA